MKLDPEIGTENAEESYKVLSPPSTTKKIFLKVGGVLAVVLHPCFLFFYCFLFLLIHFKIGVSYPYFWNIVLSIFLLTVVFPAIFPLLYAKDGFLKDRRKRPLSILVTLISYGICFVFVVYIQNVFMSNYSHNTFNVSSTIPQDIEKEYIQPTFQIASNEVLYILSILIIGLIFIFIVSFWFKISLHANGIGFVFALTIVLHFLEFFLGRITFLLDILLVISVLLCCIVLLWQRVASGCHTLKEVFFGFILGFIITIISSVFFALLSPANF